MNRIDYKKCEEIKDKLVSENSEDVILGDGWLHSVITENARKIEGYLFNMQCKGEITKQEHDYIFGMICTIALKYNNYLFYKI